jgi:hypothetical protein
MKDFYRKATTQEMQLYQEKIYALQDVILSLTTIFLFYGEGCSGCLYLSEMF